jgi:hypothetical protein
LGIVVARAATPDDIDPIVPQPEQVCVNGIVSKKEACNCTVGQDQ